MGSQDSWAGGSSQFPRLSLGTGGRDPDQDQDRAGPGQRGWCPLGTARLGRLMGVLQALAALKRL